MSSGEAFLAADYDTVIALLDEDRTVDGDFMLAITHTRIGEYEKALEVLEGSRGRRRPMAMALRADAEVRKGNYDEARALLDATVNMPKADRERDRVAYEYAYLAWAAGDTDELARALAIDSFGTMEQQANDLRGWLALRQLRLDDAIEYFLRGGMGPDTWSKYCSLLNAAYIARETYRPQVMASIERLAILNPPRYLIPNHFEIVRSSAWFLAIQNDFQGALTRLREADKFGGDRYSRIAVLLDRGYIALAFGNKECGRDDIDGALDLARNIEWSEAPNEQRRHLLTLASLLADRRVFDARWCLRQYFALKPTKGAWVWSTDPRSKAFEAFARGCVAGAEGNGQVAHMEFGAAFAGFKEIKYDWRAVLTLLAREDCNYRHSVSSDYIEKTLKCYPNSWLRSLIERQVSITNVPAPIGSLTAMQTRVLTLVAQGMTNKAIGVELGKSPKTVAEHVTPLLRAFHCKSRQQLQRKYHELMAGAQ